MYNNLRTKPSLRQVQAWRARESRYLTVHALEGRSTFRGFDMSRKYLIGAAAVALVAAAGPARAADVMPIVVSVTPTVAPVVVGPMVTVEVTAGPFLDYDDLVDLYVGVQVFGEVDVKTASGWGFNFQGAAGAYFIPGFQFGYGYRAELYRVIGNAEIGFFVQPYDFAPLGIDFGPTFRYETNRFEFRHVTAVSYLGAWHVDFQNDVMVHVNDRLDVGGNLDFGFGTFGTQLGIRVDAEMDVTDRLTIEGWAWADLLPAFNGGVGGQATLDFGALSPYVAAWVSPGGGTLVAGVEIEHPIGTGPFTLVGGTAVNYVIGGGAPDFGAYVGIRFNRGDRDNLLFVDDGS